MTHPLASLIQSGTRLWLDSIDPQLIAENRALGATGATSNPVIVADLLKTGRFDDRMEVLLSEGLSDDEIAWQMTDELVSDAEAVFREVWEATQGDDGYVSFELDPLLEDTEFGPPHAQRVAEYVQLGQHWAAGHPNRLIKVPATAAGIEALTPLVAAGVNVNVTLLFTERQYEAARAAVWEGAGQRASLEQFKSVYSVFVSRIDVYTEQHVPELPAAAQGQVGIVNAKRVWWNNHRFWADHPTPLKQEIVFASTGTKKPEDEPWKYVVAFAGSDIQTNPPATNQAVAESGLTFSSAVEQLPPQEVLDAIDAEVNFARMEQVLMREGIVKFASPQGSLLQLIAQKRAALAT